MDKAKLIELRGIAEQRCNELFRQLQDVTTELERTRGDYRTYDSLLLNWEEKVEPEIIPAVVGSFKGMDTFSTETRMNTSKDLSKKVKA